MDNKPIKGFLLAAAIFIPSGAVFAQSSDKAYCNALKSTYQKTKSGHERPTAAVADAMTQCNSNPRAAIPVLEKQLTDANVALPKR